MKCLSLTCMFLLSTATIAFADCIYDGQTYPTGTEIGGLVCQPDGTWKPE